MFKNPEILRNTWVHLTKYKLIAAPVLLFLFYVVVTSSCPKNYCSTTSADVIFFIMKVIILVYGSLLAIFSISKEVSEHTWDLQKISSLSSWTLLFGKLFGGTIYAWYCFTVASVFYFNEVFYFTNKLEPILSFIQIIIYAVALHALAIIFTLIAMQKKVSSVVLFAVGFTSFTYIILYTLTEYGGSLSIKAEMDWYGNTINVSNINWFIIGQLVFIAFWAIVGANRLMSKELSYKNRIFTWIIFLFTTTINLFGFIYSEAPDGVLFLFLMSLAALYIMILIENKTWHVYKNIIVRFKNFDFSQIIIEMPRWLISLIFSILFLAFMLFFIENDEFLACLALLPFVLRDIAIFLIFNTRSNKQLRADIISLICIVTLYTLIPAFVTIIFHQNSSIDKWSASLFLPIFYKTYDLTSSNTFIVLAQPLILWIILLRMWSKKLTVK